MMDIVEKLGVTKAPWRTWHLGVNEFIQDSECTNMAEMMNDNWVDAQLIATAPEMLEALIIDLKATEEEGWCEVCKDHEHRSDCKKVLAVEKATGKTWEEIKELLC